MSELDRELEHALRKILLQGTEQMSIDLEESQIKKLLMYICEFEKWNKAYNLSAIRDIQQMVKRHLLDSLSVVPFLKQTRYNTENIADIGTGGGLPGIPLAIVLPQKQFTLVDSNGKKTRFLFHIKTLLQLNNVEIENRRIEKFQPQKKYHAVISRAFSSLEDMTRHCEHLLHESGIFIAMKGQYPAEELQMLNDKIAILESIKLNVAETDGERHLLILKRKSK